MRKGEIYRERMERIGREEGEMGMGGELEKRIGEEMEDIEEKIGEGGGNKRGWWDKECRERKKEVKKELRNWRKRGEREESIKRRKETIRIYAKGKRKRRMRDGKRERER